MLTYGDVLRHRKDPRLEGEEQRILLKRIPHKDRYRIEYGVEPYPNNNCTSHWEANIAVETARVNGCYPLLLQEPRILWADGKGVLNSFYWKSSIPKTKVFGVARTKEEANKRLYRRIKAEGTRIAREQKITLVDLTE